MLGVDPLYLILVIASTFLIVYSISIKGIFYNSPDTDNELMVYAAAQSKKWRWLSDVHKYAASSYKVSMKEWTVFILSIFQKILKDKKSDRPYAIMTGTAVSLCSILLYLVASNYFNPLIGFIVAILYIISFWPWQVSMYGGHANMANLFFLLSVYSIQSVALISIVPPILLILFSGALFGLCLFSSASSQKYLIAIMAALFFSQYQFHNIAEIINNLPVNKIILFDVATIAFILISYVIVLLFYKSVVNKMYSHNAPDFLNKMISERDKFTKEHYINHAYKKITRIGRWTFGILFFCLILINLIPLTTLLGFTVGLIIAFFFLTLPNIKENFSYYLAYMLETKRKTHFRSYIDDFAKKGITVQRNTRGAGLSWVPKIFWIFAPFHLILFVTTLAIGIYQAKTDLINTGFVIIITFISLSPVIWAEMTNAPQVSRLYSPSLITILLLPAYILYTFELTTDILIFITAFIALCFAWNLWRFVEDVYPARMRVKILVQILNRLGIKEVYTYKTNHNIHLVNAVPGIGKSEYLPAPEKEIITPFRVTYIEKISDVKDGWIVIPSIDFISMTLENTLDDDFTKDQLLQQMIKTGQINQIASIKLKTPSASEIWPHEDEVTSYCVLYLKGIKSNDNRGYAWLVHSSKLNFNS